jgi:deoxyribose-phosphate aldolase
VALSAVKKSTRFPNLSGVPAVDEVGVNERVARFQSRSIKKSAKVDALKVLTGHMVYTLFRPPVSG